MKKLLSLFVAVLVSVGLTGGLVAANSGAIETTGPDSENWIQFNDEGEVTVNNNTGVGASISASQSASSGDAKVSYNTTGGDAESGDATNENEVAADLSINNSGSSAAALGGVGNGGSHDGSITETGPRSTNWVQFNNNSSVVVNNSTSVSFSNSTSQTANTGDATVRMNTTGGDASTGSATNTSSSTFTLSVTN